MSDKDFEQLENSREKAESRRARIQAKKEAHLSKVDKALAKSKVREEKAERARKKKIKDLGGRSATRVASKVKAGSVRKRSNDLEPFVSSDKIKFTEDLVPHNGEDQNGRWQLEYLKSQGLKPEHTIADIGCGDLLEGVPLIRYLNADRYIGIDQNPMVISQGFLSLTEEDLAKNPRFYLGGNFGVEQLGIKLNFAWANSVFSHIDLPLIAKCMASVYQALAPGGVFMATFFLFEGKPGDAWLGVQDYRITKNEDDVNKYTYGYRNPFHYHGDHISKIAEEIGYTVEIIDASHYKRQHVLKMVKA